MSTADQALRLSGRLSVIADSVRVCAKAYPEKPRLADIGCDHALIPASLLLSGEIAFAYASDIREGPLAAARENAADTGTEDRMRFVLADGLSGIGKGKADICVIAGMGGELIRAILETGDAFEKGITSLVLSPHTKQEVLREYLAQSPYRIAAETMTEEDGKFYPVITACTENAPAAEALSLQSGLFETVPEALAGETGCTAEDAKHMCMLFGPLLLERGDAVLQRYLQRQQARLSGILERTAKEQTVPEAVAERMRLVAYALKRYESGNEEVTS